MPASLVSIRRSMPVSVLRTMTAAPGTEDPDGSVTVPVIDAEPASWPNATDGTTASNTASTVNRPVLRISFLLWKQVPFAESGYNMDPFIPMKSRLQIYVEEVEASSVSDW